MRKLYCSAARLALAAGLLSLFTQGLRADSAAYFTYCINFACSLDKVDLNTGAYSTIANISSPVNPAGGTDLAYSGLGVANGKIYTVINESPFGGSSGGYYGNWLASINTSTGGLTLVGQMNGADWSRLGSTTSGLFMVGNEGGTSPAALYSLNSATGAATLIGSLGLAGNTDVDSLSVNSGTLYAEVNNNLYTLNTSTGAATLVKSLSTYAPQLENLLFENGASWGINGQGGYFYDTVNTATGQVTDVVAAPAAYYTVGLAPYPVSSGTTPPATTPEPASYALIGAGIGVLGLIRRWSRLA